MVGDFSNSWTILSKESDSKINLWSPSDQANSNPITCCPQFQLWRACSWIDNEAFYPCPHAIPYQLTCSSSYRVTFAAPVKVKKMQEHEESGILWWEINPTSMSSYYLPMRNQPHVLHHVFHVILHDSFSYMPLQKDTQFNRSTVTIACMDEWVSCTTSQHVQ